MAKEKRTFVEISMVNDRGHIGYQFEGGRWSSARVREDKKGQYFMSGGLKYYVAEAHEEFRLQGKTIQQ